MANRIQLGGSATKQLLASISDGDIVQFNQALAPATVRALQRTLADKPGVTLRLYDERATELSVLAGFGSLRKLTIQCRALTSFDEVGALVNLEQLDLGETTSKLPAVGVVSKLVKLRSLSIEGHGKGIESVLELPALEELRLRRVNLARVEPRHLAQLHALSLAWCPGAVAHAAIGAPNLRTLQLAALRDASAADLAPLSELRRLEALSLDSVGKLASLDFLDGSPIRSLEIENATGLRSLVGLAGCSQLERLTLRNVPHLASLAGLESCRRLHSLELANARPTDRALAPLLACQALADLSSADAYPKPEVASFLAAWRGKRLWIRGKYLRDLAHSASKRSTTA